MKNGVIRKWMPGMGGIRRHGEVLGKDIPSGIGLWECTTWGHGTEQ